MAALEYFEFDSMVELFEVLDVDGSGELDKEEFTEGLVSLSLARHNQVPRELFLMMKMMRIIKRRFNDIQNLIEYRGHNSARRKRMCSLPARPVSVVRDV